MDEIKIGAEIVFNITGNHNIGYAKWERYIGTVLSKDHRSRLYVRTIGMPRACIDERDVEWIIDPDGDFDMDEAIPNPVARELYKLMGRYVYTLGRSHESINGYIVYECMEDYVDNEKIEGVDVYYDQISEIVYLAKIILEEMEGKDHGESS